MGSSSGSSSDDKSKPSHKSDKGNNSSSNDSSSDGSSDKESSSARKSAKKDNRNGKDSSNKKKKHNYHKHTADTKPARSNTYSKMKGSSGDSSNENDEPSHKSDKRKNSSSNDSSSDGSSDKESSSTLKSSKSDNYNGKDSSNKKKKHKSQKHTADTKPAKRNKHSKFKSSSFDSIDEKSKPSHKSDKGNNSSSNDSSSDGSSDKESSSARKSTKSDNHHGKYSSNKSSRGSSVTSDKSDAKVKKGVKAKRGATAPDESESSAKTIYSGYEANMDNLCALLDQDGIRDLPIVVVPVAGEFRTGKSFLLSYFLRYLTYKDFGDEKEKLVGFDHANSDKPVTQGIKIWHEPLIVEKRKSKKKVLVLLMDSQGIFNRRDKEEATRIFALTTMISSLMIFNLKGQLNEAVLGQLKLFSAHAKQANAEDTNDEDVPFQKLTLLIRDWEKTKPPFGFDGGKEYCDSYFLGEDGADSEFESYFQDVDCYLMPHPGKVVNIEGYDGSMKKLSGPFKKHMRKFIEDFFDIDHLLGNVKEVAGDPITAGDFCDYFKLCTKMLDNVDWKQPTNMLEMNASFKCEIAIKDARAVYTEYMDKATDSWKDTETDSLLTEEQLLEIARKASEEAKTKFEDMSSFARKNVKKIYKEFSKKLKMELGEAYATYKKKLDAENNKKKREMEQQKQNDAIHDITQVFTGYMQKESNSYIDKITGSFITEHQLESIHSCAIKKAVEEFEDKCKMSGSSFPEMNTENKEKLIKDLKEELPRYRKELEDEQEKRINQEQQNQFAAMEKAKEVYNAYMDHEIKPWIEANEIVDERKINKVSKEAANEAREKYEEVCEAESIFKSKFRENREKLTQDLKVAEFDKYKQKLEMDKENQKKDDLDKQNEAIAKAKEHYIVIMDQKTNSIVVEEVKALMNDGELQSINEQAKTEAIQKYEDMCKKFGNHFYNTYKENKEKLVEALAGEFPNYEKKLKTTKEERINQEELIQSDAKRKAIQIYSAHMGKETTSFIFEFKQRDHHSSLYNTIFRSLEEFIAEDNKNSKETFMTEENLRDINDAAISLALRNFDNKSIANGICFQDLYNQHRKELAEEMKDEFMSHKKRWDDKRERWETQQLLKKVVKQQNEAEEKEEKKWKAEKDKLELEERNRKAEQIKYEQHLKAEQEKQKSDREESDKKEKEKRDLEEKKRIDNLENQLKEEQEKHKRDIKESERKRKVDEEVHDRKREAHGKMLRQEMEKKLDMDRKLLERKRLNMAQAVGIDLGTTYSCVAVMLQDQSIEIVAVDQANRIMPSYVAFTEEENLIGLAAKTQLPFNHTNTIFDVKRLIGRKFDDPKLKEHMAKWPFEVKRNDIGNPVFNITAKGEQKEQSPEQISAMILRKLRNEAETFLGGKVTDAVITVPAYFNDSQRQATEDAAKIAGLKVLRIINEPTAAAVAYGLNEKNNKNILIFDLGGGTFDVSILTVKEEVFEVKSTTGNCDLGGRDFDDRILDHFVEEFNQKHKIELNVKAISRIRAECEKAKITLSTKAEANINIESLCDGIDFNSKITLPKFEALCDDLFHETLVPVKIALDDAKMKKSDINDVVMVGGSTHIPKVKKIIQDFFEGKDLNASKNAVEVVAEGAAIQAAILSGYQYVKKYKLVDVNPLSLGTNVTIGNDNDVMDVIIKKNTSIPTKNTKTYRTGSDNQEIMSINIYEGEDPDVKNNNLLGSFKVNGIPPRPKRQASVSVTFELDDNGTLNVTAVEKSTGKPSHLAIQTNNGRLSDAEIEKMEQEVENLLGCKNSLNRSKNNKKEEGENFPVKINHDYK